ncbi:MAG: zinc-ribbon domain-containing protein [Bacilli bacterium]|nr:zinc-ribbon domain-containing protein [Bacilli bacterium]
MFCPECGKKAKDGQKFCNECGAKLQSSNTEQWKEKAIEIEKKVSSKMPESWQKDKKKTYTIIGVVVLLLILFIHHKTSYSANVISVRSWQNAFLQEEKVTLGEVCDQIVSNAKWSDTTYEGEPAVQLTGYLTTKKANIVVIFYVNTNKNGTSFAYYSENGNKRTPQDFAFVLTENANSTAKALGRK